MLNTYCICWSESVSILCTCVTIWISMYSIFVIFCTDKTPLELFGIRLGGHSKCLVKYIKRSHYENKLQNDSWCGKLVFLVHMSDSTLQIVPQRLEKIHETWDSTYIYRRTLCLYFREEVKAVYFYLTSTITFLQNRHVHSYFSVTGADAVFWGTVTSRPLRSCLMLTVRSYMLPCSLVALVTWLWTQECVFSNSTCWS